GRRRLPDSRRRSYSLSLFLAEKRRAMPWRLERHQRRRRDPPCARPRPGAYGGHDPRRLGHALPVEAFQSGVPPGKGASLPGLALRSLALGAAALLAQSAPAADDAAWPNRAVRIVATSPPGGSVDLLARLLAQDLTKKHGQPFVVENRPGANGDLGVASVLRAPA